MELLIQLLVGYALICLYLFTKKFVCSILGHKYAKDHALRCVYFCLRCGVDGYHHIYHQYIDDNSCISVEKCDKCEFVNKQENVTISHSFTGFEYISDGSCEQNRRCIRCGVKQENVTISHSFTGFEYISDGSCEQNRRCIRCGVEDMATEHAFSHDFNSSTIFSPSASSSHTCDRCKITKICTFHACGERTEHEYYDNCYIFSTTITTYKCSSCGFEK